jgi:hypothetical protein
MLEVIHYGVMVYGFDAIFPDLLPTKDEEKSLATSAKAYTVSLALEYLTYEKALRYATFGKFSSTHYNSGNRLWPMLGVYKKYANWSPFGSNETDPLSEAAAAAGSGKKSSSSSSSSSGGISISVNVIKESSDPKKPASVTTATSVLGGDGAGTLYKKKGYLPLTSGNTDDNDDEPIELRNQPDKEPTAPIHLVPKHGKGDKIDSKNKKKGDFKSKDDESEMPSSNAGGTTTKGEKNKSSKSNNGGGNGAKNSSGKPYKKSSDKPGDVERERSYLSYFIKNFISDDPAVIVGLLLFWGGVIIFLSSQAYQYFYRCALVVEGLPSTFINEELLHALPGSTSVYFVKGVYIVEFASNSEAAKCLIKSTSDMGILFKGRSLSLSWAEEPMLEQFYVFVSGKFRYLIRWCLRT